MAAGMLPRTSLLAIAAALLSACAVPRPSDLPDDQEWVVAVKSCELPFDTWYGFAHHSWVDVRSGDRGWRRIEVSGPNSGVRVRGIAAPLAYADERWGPVRVWNVITGEQARELMEPMETFAEAHDERYRSGYETWPGPNSNTAMRELFSRVDGLASPLHHNAVGKDYEGWFGAGVTPSGTGVQVDTLPVGFAVGAREGLELHLLGLTFAAGVWPPRLALPGLEQFPPPRAPSASRVPPPTPVDVREGLPWSEYGRARMSHEVGVVDDRLSVLLQRDGLDLWLWYDLHRVPADDTRPEGAVAWEVRRHGRGLPEFRDAGGTADLLDGRAAAGPFSFGPATLTLWFERRDDGAVAVTQELEVFAQLPETETALPGPSAPR